MPHFVQHFSHGINILLWLTSSEFPLKERGELFQIFLLINYNIIEQLTSAVKMEEFVQIPFSQLRSLHLM